MPPRLAAFVYDFPHEKSTQGLLHLPLAAPDEVLVIAAPRVELAHGSKPAPLAALHPRLVSEALGFDYVVTPHGEAAEALVRFEPDCAVVLGARILPPAVTSLGIPIYNLHPGVLPENRGLDAPEWAVLNDLPQGVTAHLVTDRIDGGSLLGVMHIPGLLPSATLAGVRSQLWEVELRMLRELLLLLRAGPPGNGPALPVDRLGEYHSKLPPPAHADAERLLPSYADRYASILEAWTREHGEVLGHLAPELCRPERLAY